MKTTLLSFLSMAFAFGSFAQRVEIGGNASLDFPNRAIMPKMGVVKSLGFVAAFRPVSTFPLALELKGSLGQYSSQILPQTYIFSNGDQTSVDVNYRSNMHKLLFGAKIKIGSEYRVMNFFVTPQIGAAFLNSRIYIEDPNTQQGECKALESSHPHRYKTGVYGGEIGTQINLSRIASGSGSYNHRLNLSFNFLAGFKPVDYINVKYMQDGPHGVAGEEPMDHGDPDRELTATFVNVTTNATHSHKIAELYRTPLQMWGFSIGYVYAF